MKNITFGLDTFGNVSLDESGNPVSAAQVIRDVLAQGQLADELGLNNFNIGEHHRDDFAVTAPDTILAGLATTTKNITLGTGVTVLSSEDPVRVYQRFATIDALSNGRVQITAGRGSFIESFPLFGYELADYNDLFEQKLELLVELLKEEPVTWSGSMRAGLSNQQVYPKTEVGQMPLRVGVGGSPESVLRAARLNIPMALAIIGGDPARFEPFARLYKETLAKLGMPELPVSVHSPGHVAETDDQAIEEAWPGYEASFGKIGLERGWGPTSKEHFLSEVYHGSMYVGSPETVAKKIVHALSSVGATRFDLKYDMGPLSHTKLSKSIELYATKVVPMVREMLETA
ncbi:putative oxidoreductase protein [Candidatus Aquiluna sp. IMCC13023]|uniref:Atu2307/SP_0267 family LLM class monooxygenase n=1 Tax=Candidatus Aquiluna sp. IMCC13023 TaxID=1081644 RepID=UPI00025B20D8|nr:Atu2307/SP_0267 family LLM class monooxygenase [Candidatus Aquiluna sp. IMCC13023]EIC91900.1 putative oxidoreductase protein [Candidatus Aquiluna sp. IMCC13023]